MEDLSGFSSKEELLKYNSSRDVLYQETLSQDFSSDELFPDEALPQDLSLEDSFATETASQHLSSEKSSTGGDKPAKDLSSQEDLAIKNDPELPDIGHDIKKSLKAVMQWCDDVANTPTDIITNFKLHIPFIIILVVLILLLWVLKFIYG